MKPDPNKRIIERKTKNGWVCIQMAELKKGDCFRIFEPNGELVTDVPELIATQDAYCCEKKDDGFEVWGVETNLQDK